MERMHHHHCAMCVTHMICVYLSPSRSSTPIFFILFPGYSPSKDIEEYARKLGKTVESGDLTLISMGQGQEGPAEAVLDR